jgi:AcrR family transcriptional regulator
MTLDLSRPALRADAQRSRKRLIDAATSAFAREQAPTLKDIARDAGVGIGTLFRHFPTREALVEEVYRGELERLCGRAPALIQDMPADRALREWMGQWSAFVMSKRGMADSLEALMRSGAVEASETIALLTEAVGVILDAGRASQTLRRDARADDVVAALMGTLIVACSPERSDQAARLLDLLMAGLRVAADFQPPVAPGES